MKRAELYRVYRGDRKDPRKTRVFAVVSRQLLIDSKYETVICAPVYSSYSGLSTQVPVGVDEGLKHESAIHCDGLMSVPKSLLTDFVGRLDGSKIEHLNKALEVSVGLR